MRNVVAALIVIASCNGGSINSSAAQATDDAVAACIQRGIAYFKEIGSWPKLSDGRDAAEVAAERCWRTTTAFP